MDNCSRWCALTTLCLTIACGGCRSTGGASAAGAGVRTDAPVAQPGSKAFSGSVAGRGQINIAGGTLKVGGLADSAKVNFISRGQGTLYVKTSNRTAAAIEAMIMNGNLLVDGERQRDSSRFVVAEMNDGPDEGYTQVRLRQ